jgi:hypothetical protein
MSITTRSGQIVALDKLIDETELNMETRGVLSELFGICQRFDRSSAREAKFKAKRMGGGTNDVATIKMPPPFVANNYVEPEKKSLTAQPVEQVENDPEPIEVEAKEETPDLKIFNLFTEGIEKAKADYPKVGAFKKVLKDLGIQGEGKTHEDLWPALESKYNEIAK